MALVGPSPVWPGTTLLLTALKPHSWWGWGGFRSLGPDAALGIRQLWLAGSVCGGLTGQMLFTDAPPGITAWSKRQGCPRAQGLIERLGEVHWAGAQSWGPDPACRS